MLGRLGLERPPIWATVAIVAGIVAIGVMLPLALNRGTPPASEPSPTVAPTTAIPSSEATATSTTPTAEAGVVVSVLSDGHAGQPGSWYRRTIEAGQPAGVKAGTLVDDPTADAAGLVGRLDEVTANADLVLIQVGTNAIVAGADAATAAAPVQALVEGVRQRGAQPVIVLVPPNDLRPSPLRALNDLLRAYAEQQHLPVLDLFTPFARQDGTWRPGLSTDHVRAADPAGTEPMARAALEQLPAILEQVG